jgi:L-serine dehydratase
MPVSVFDLFKIGIGPSSSHTVGPMRIASTFARSLVSERLLDSTSSIEVHLYGSLALTGRGHATDRAAVLGLLGFEPETIDAQLAELAYYRLRQTSRLSVGGLREIAFAPASQIVFHTDQTLPEHPNGMRLLARGASGNLIADKTSFSVGGGFVVSSEQMASPTLEDGIAWPHSYKSARELLALCRASGATIADVALANEEAIRPRAQVMDGLDKLQRTMMACMDRGLSTEGVLPGGLGVRRRASAMYDVVRQRVPGHGPLRELDWVNAFAVAVNEENAAGGQVVTAPTNGAAGILPAVMRYHAQFCGGVQPDAARTFLLTAAAIGSLYKENASISGAVVGCQGEVGVASSMAAAGLAAVLGASVEQVENAAEIAMEHHLGMTCDPVGGLVQIPCIERNAMGAVKAINAAHLALAGDGQHLISLDRVIDTMRQTGADMNDKYKETSLGGLAVSIVAC